MSRTYKTRPYWVRLNQDATITDHDHRHLGKDHYRRKYLKDAKGEDVYREVDVVCTADQYIDRSGWRNLISSYWDDKTRPATTEPIMTYNTARELHSAGRGDEIVVIERKMERAYELVYSHTTPDHCTEGFQYNRQTWKDWRHFDLPCTPELTREQYHHSWSGATPGFKRSWSREWYGHERVRANSVLTRTAKEWNSGYEVDDWDEDTYITGQHRHGAAWYM